MKRETNEQTNSMNDDEERIAEMLRGLKQVAAPNDFEFRVNARIARGRPAENSGWGFAPVFRTAVPLLLVLVVAGFLIGNYHYSVDSNAVAVMPETDLENETFERVARDVRSEDFVEPGLDTGPKTPPAETFVNDTALAAADHSGADVPVSGPLAMPSAADAEPVPAGGSFDSALSTSNRSIMPPGISRSPRIRIETNADVSRRPITAERILRQIGIEAEFTAGKWFAKGVRAKSPADRSGIRAGDAITAIDGRVLGADTEFAGIFTGRTLKVERGGETLFIDIR